MTRSPRAAAALFLLSSAFGLAPTAQAGILVLAWLLVELDPEFRPFSPLRERAFHRYEWTSLGFLVAAVVLNGVFGEGTDRYVVAGLSLSPDGLQFGLRTALRLILAGTAMIVLLFPLSREGLARTLRSSHISPEIVAASLVSLTLLEELPDRFRDIREAQTSRGADWSGPMLQRLRLLRLAVAPLLYRSLDDAVRLGTALHLRGLHHDRGLAHTSERHGKRSTTAIALIVMAIMVFIHGILEWLDLSPFAH